MKNKNNITGKQIGILILLIGIVLFFWTMTLKDPNRFSRWRWEKHRLPIKTNEIALCENIPCQKWVSLRRCDVVIVSIFAKTKTQTRDKLDSLIKKHSREIKDEIRSVVASADHRQIRDPYLKDITSAITDGVEKIIGPGYIQKIMIPTWHINPITKMPARHPSSGSYYKKLSRKIRS